MKKKLCVHISENRDNNTLLLKTKEIILIS